MGEATQSGRFCSSRTVVLVHRCIQHKSIRFSYQTRYCFGSLRLMPRLLIDPNTTQCPNYTLAIYQAVRAPFVTPQITDEQAAVLLTNVWTAQNVIERQQWQEQINEDMAEVEARRQVMEEEEGQRREELEKERQEQRKEEVRKNKSKFVPIPARGVPTQPPVIASVIAN